MAFVYLACVNVMVYAGNVTRGHRVHGGSLHRYAAHTLYCKYEMTSSSTAALISGKRISPRDSIIFEASIVRINGDAHATRLSTVRIVPSALTSLIGVVSSPSLIGER